MIWIRRCDDNIAVVSAIVIYNVILNVLKHLDLKSCLTSTIGLQILTLYLFSPICSTWNLLAHLHWATCLVTWDTKNGFYSKLHNDAKPTKSILLSLSIPHPRFYQHLLWVCKHLCWGAKQLQIHSSRCSHHNHGQRYQQQPSSPACW